MANIVKENGFTTCSYSLTALPLVPYLKLDGFSGDGVTWDDVEVSKKIIGADGLTVTNRKPVIYSGTFSLLPNSPARNILDGLVMASTPSYGKTLASYEIVLVEKNNTTGMTYIYSGGSISTMKGGNDNNLDNGQGNKTYKIEFDLRAQLPL